MDESVVRELAGADEVWEILLVAGAQPKRTEVGEVALPGQGCKLIHRLQARPQLTIRR